MSPQEEVLFRQLIQKISRIEKLIGLAETHEDTAITALATKVTPVDADAVVITDSAAADAPKRTTWANIKATLKAYFDTLYGLLASANTWTANNAFNSTATTGSALSVTRNLTSTSTDSPVASIVQDHATDDQTALRLQQDGTGNILSLFDGASEVLKVEDGGNVGLNHTNPAYKLHMLTATDDGIYVEGSGIGGPIVVLDATNATPGNRYTGLIYASGGVRQWSAQLRAGDGHYHFYDIVNSLTRMLLTNTGNVGIGPTTGGAVLGKAHIDQGSTTAAIPVLILDQADLSEEFIQFEATVGAGNPIDTAAIGTYYGKVRVSVNGTFKFMALYNS